MSLSTPRLKFIDATPKGKMNALKEKIKDNNAKIKKFREIENCIQIDFLVEDNAVLALAYAKLYRDEMNNVWKDIVAVRPVVA